jgi:hypothetical protein
MLFLSFFQLFKIELIEKEDEAGCGMLDTGCWIRKLYSGYWILIWYWIFGIEL